MSASTTGSATPARRARRAHDAHRRALHDVAAIDRTAAADLGAGHDGHARGRSRAVGSPRSSTGSTASTPPATSPGRSACSPRSRRCSATDTPERLDRYEARLRAFPAYLDAWADVVARRVAAGVTSPRVVDARSIDQLERRARARVDESPALLPVSPTTAPRPATASSEVVRDVVNPALQGYREVFRDVLPHATETVGLGACPEARSCTPRRS